VLQLFAGDDWAQDHHDAGVMDSSGATLARARLPEGGAGMTRLHAMIASLAGDRADEEDVQVLAGIETGRGPWVQALTAAGYLVFGVNPLQAARYRERHAVSGAKSDAGDAHVLAGMVRTDSHQLRQVAGDSAEAGAVKVVTRMHKTLIWERTRHVQRLRHALADYFPAALEASGDLDAPTPWNCWRGPRPRARRPGWPSRRSAPLSSAPAAARSVRRPRRSRRRCAPGIWGSRP
jgi:transposase